MPSSGCFEKVSGWLVRKTRIGELRCLHRSSANLDDTTVRVVWQGPVLSSDQSKAYRRRSRFWAALSKFKANYESAVALHWRTLAGAAPALLSNTVKMRGLNLLANLPERGDACIVA
jgi:hypothetical protein